MWPPHELKIISLAQFLPFCFYSYFLMDKHIKLIGLIFCFWYENKFDFIFLMKLITKIIVKTVFKPPLSHQTMNEPTNPLWDLKFFDQFS
jgi:hypothetical protein